MAAETRKPIFYRVYFQLLLYLSLVSFVCGTDIDYVSSSYHLKQLIQHDKDLHSFMKNHHFSTEWQTIQMYYSSTVIRDMNSYDIRDNVTQIVENPVKIYLLVRRHVVEWSSLAKFIQDSHPKSEMHVNFENLMLKYTEKFNLPTKNDLNTAMQSILRLKQIFKLGVEQFTDPSYLFNCSLTSSHLFEIGMYAYDQAMYTHAIDFVYEAMKKLDLGRQEEIISEIIRKHDEKLQRKQNGSLEYSEFGEFIPSYLFGDLIVSVHSNTFENRTEEILQPKLFQPKDPLVVMNTFEALCRGEVLRPALNISRLKCFNSYPHPYFALSPLKSEIHNIYPLIIQFHDVLSEKQMHDIILEAEPSMAKSQVGGLNRETEKNVDFEDIQSRTSSNTWIFDDFIGSNSKFSYLNKKIKVITGLDTTHLSSVEILQIASYLPGGHYIPHIDNIMEKSVLQYMNEDEIFKEDRIATFMVYLSEVEKGGSTVFPVLGVQVEPVKGSALFWYNQNPDGSVNRNMIHAGCPVLHGIKFVGNKWIRSNDQMFLKKCPKNFRRN